MAAKHRAKHQMDKPRVKPRCCCRSYWWIIWSFLSFSFFFPFFFLVLLNFFFFLFPAMWSQRNQAWCLHPVLTPVITHSRFSILIVAHPVFWACSSIRNSRNKGFPSWLLEFPLPCRNFRWHRAGASWWLLHTWDSKTQVSDGKTIWKEPRRKETLDTRLWRI